MSQVDESTVYEEIESSLRDTPSSVPWDDVIQLNITDPRSESWRRYKERLSGLPAEEFLLRTGDRELTEMEVGSENAVWKDVSNQILQTFNKLFPDFKANNLNGEECESVTVEEIENSFIGSVDNEELFRNSIFIDVICDPILKNLSEKIGDVGICCESELLRSQSKAVPLNYICGKRADLGGTTDWVMRRYGGNRRESSIFVAVMWGASWLMFATCGNYGMRMAVDTCIGGLPGIVLDHLIAKDGDRTTHPIDKTELGSAMKSSREKALTTAGRIRLGMESALAPRRAYKQKYSRLYEEISRTADPKRMTPNSYFISRLCEGMYTFSCEMAFSSDFGEGFDTMTGSVYQLPIDTGLHYNDLSDAVMDLKYMETHNYVICAKANSNYSFSDHSEALYVALTTFDEPHSKYDSKIKRRMCRYRFASAVYIALWPRYRVPERARRFVGALSKEDRNKLILRGRRCILGDVHIEENIWLDAICSNYNNRRAEIQKRGYTQTLLYLLGVEADPNARDHIHSAIKANGMRPFDTGLELVMSLGSMWLAQLALRSVKESASYDELVAELSDLLSILSLSSLPIIYANVVTPCESICGPVFLRLTELLTILSGINTVAGEAVLSTVASIISMVSLDPYRCIAYQADMLLMSN